MAYISLVTLGVQDVPRATQFYEALGWNKSTYSVDDVVSFLAGGTVVLALYGRDALSNDANSPATASYAVHVESPAADDEAMATAAAAGANVSAPATRMEWGGYVGYFADADGHLWEVAHNPDFPLGDEGQVYLPGLEAFAEQQQQQTEATISDFVAGTVVSSASAVSACVRPSNSRMTSAIRWRSGRRPISATIWRISSASSKQIAGSHSVVDTARMPISSS